VWVFVVGLDEAGDFVDQFFDTAECSATNGSLCNDIEPDLNLVQP
jgi:hypothetical protein